MTAREFSVKPAVRESVPLLVGVFGPSGGGKTFSALRLATGIQIVTGGDIYGIDTEARRMLHYADLFKFKHLQFDAPFGSLDYLAAIRHCAKEGGKIIIVDSMSHEHEGPGGLLDYHDKEYERLGNKESVNMLAWARPKAARRELLNGILQIPASFIFCFRAKEKIKLLKDAKGKVQVVPQGWMPIAGDEFVYEMTVNCLLLPRADGVPTWSSEEPGERSMMKLPQQFREIFATQAALSEGIGVKLATWAAGGVQPPKSEPAGTGSQPFRTSGEPVTTETQLEAEARAAARLGGREGLQTYWKTLTQPQRRMIKPLLEELKATAIEAEAAIEADAVRETDTAEDEIVL